MGASTRGSWNVKIYGSGLITALTYNICIDLCPDFMLLLTVHLFYRRS